MPKTKIELDQIDLNDSGKRQDALNTFTDAEEALPGEVLTIDELGNAVFEAPISFNVDGGAPSTIYTINQHVDGGTP